MQNYTNYILNIRTSVTMRPLWTKESDEKANKWHEQQKRSSLGSTGSPGVCYILLQYRTLKTLLHSLNVVFGIITSDFGFWGEKGLFGKKLSKTDKRWASAVTSSSSIRSQSKMESRNNVSSLCSSCLLLFIIFLTISFTYVLPDGK